MARLNKLSIIDTALALGWKPSAKLTTELTLVIAEKYLEKYNLTKVELDRAFINPDKSINKHCYKETEIKNILKDKENEQ